MNSSNKFQDSLTDKSHLTFPHLNLTMPNPFRFIFGIIKKVYLHFDMLPAAVDLENSRFYTVSNVAETLAWMAHFVWFFILYNLEVYPLAWFQLFSIGSYALAIALNRKGNHMASMTIALAEIVIHQVIAVKFLGVASGFQYFIPVVGIFPFLKPRGNLVWKCLLLIMCLSGFLYIQLFMVETPPLYSISTFALAGFNISNIVLAFGFIGMWAFYLNIAISRAEIILRKRTKELAIAEEKAEKDKMKFDLEVNVRDNEIFRLRNIELLEKNRQIEEEKNKSRKLLLNILPEETAVELMDKGKATTKEYASATVIFADFVGFTKTAELLDANELITQIDNYFIAFDQIMIRNRIEKIKTIGDAYMAAGGLPGKNESHSLDAVQAALEMLEYAEGIKKEYKHPFDLRIGIHTGPLVAGVVGNHKFQFDIWGDTVNVAARMEQNSIAGRINISGSTYELIQDQFFCEHRGKINAKNKGAIDMYFIKDRKIHCAN